MRNFNEGDRLKKSGRISLPENPGNLSPEMLTRLETAVRSKTVDNHIPCPLAWKIAENVGATKLDVGVMIDRLGIRITDCQLGCFKVDKSSHPEAAAPPFSAEVALEVGILAAAEALTCTNVFELAQLIGTAARAVAEAANAQGLKLKQCQLGCF